MLESWRATRTGHAIRPAPVASFGRDFGRTAHGGSLEMPQEWDASKLIEHLAAAGAKGRTKSDLAKKIPAAHRSKSASILSELRSAGSIKGPFKNRSEYYFAPQFAPTRVQAEGLIENFLRDAGLRLATKSDRSDRTTGFFQIFFKDALASLKSEARILELRRGRSTFYVHRDAVLEQLRLADDSGGGALRETQIQRSGHADFTLDDVRPVYARLNNEHG